jgi:hypothetical protein
MSKDILRIALNAERFPFLFRDAQRAAVLPGLDMNLRNASYPGMAENIDWSVPQLLYCENVMPIARGLVSTQLAHTIDAFAPPVVDFDQAITVRDANENNTLMVPAGGKNYLLDINTGDWSSVLPFSATGKLITRAYVQGRSFVFYEKEALFEWNGLTLINRTSSLVLPAGVTITDIRGIGGASNYLLLFDDIQIFWSSPSDALNFDRALNNGSGFQIPQDLRGRISAILPVSGGAIIYTIRNAVAAVFTNNAAAPFAFRGISNSGGIASYEQVAYDADEKIQYVWGSGGLQKVALQNAEEVFPEVADFLTSGVYESFNDATNLVEQTELGSYLSVKLTFVSQRFLVISYGASVNVYTFALIFDTSLQRWGKIRVDHVDAFTYPYPNILGDLTYAQLQTDISGLTGSIASLGIGILSISPPRKSIGFLKKDGSIDVLAIDYRVRDATGTALIGQIQHNRNKMTTLHAVEVEGLDDRAIAPYVYDIISLNGKDIYEVRELTAYEVSASYRKYLGSGVGKNHCILFKGTFQMTGLLTEISKHGNSTVN